MNSSPPASGRVVHLPVDPPARGGGELPAPRWIAPATLAGNWAG
jgi:hypothetical protein